MRKIHYNLAGTRKIDSRAFALILALLVLATLLFSAGTYFNLSRQRQQEGIEKKAFGPIALRLAGLERRTRQQQTEIAAWKKTWEKKLAFANWLIARTSFSFIARLDFLEKACGAGMSVCQLSLANEPAGPVQMTVSALAQNELLRFYKKLLPYELTIANENQMAENYQANLSFRIKDEKK
jgi:hypothetical protein